jgi:hypothetical protein
MGRLITFAAAMHIIRSWVTAAGASRLAVIAVTALAVAGCGAGAGSRAVGVTQVPLPGGARIMTHVRSCDRGVNAYCAEQLVVVAPAFASSTALEVTERQLLTKRGWTSTQGADGNEKAADSPGHELRLYYATAYDDLLGIDSNWIQRAPPISHGLSNAMFDRAPAISLMLVRGSS